MSKDNENRPETEQNTSSQRSEKTTINRVTDAFLALNRDWEMTYTNSEAAELLNRSTTEIVGKNIWEEFPEATELQFKEQYEKAMKTQSAVQFEEYNPELDRWFGVWAYPSETGLSIYFRDITERRQQKIQLEQIQEATQQLIQAETTGEIAEITVESTKDILGFSATALYYWDNATGFLTPAAATESITERYSDGLPTLTGNESIIWKVFIEGETRSYDGNVEPSLEEAYNPNSPIQRRVIIPLEDHGVLHAGMESSGTAANLAEELLEVLADNVTAALERTKREQSIIEKEEELRKTNERLSELKRINAIIREIDRALIRATQRSEVEAAVAEKLSDVNTYQLAWFGTIDPQTDNLSIQASSEGKSSFLNQILMAYQDEDYRHPVEKALESGEVRFTDNLITEFNEYEWRNAALNEGYRSIASLPIQFRGTTYGVVEIYADQPNAFSEEEQTVLRELSSVIGNALSAIERKEALLADTYVELKFCLTEAEMVVSQLATSVGCDIVIESLLPRTNDTWLAYVTVEIDDPNEVLNAAEQYRAVDTINHIRSTGDGNFFGFILTELPGPDFLAEKGATITLIEAKPSKTEITVKVPHSVNVRSFIQTYNSLYPSAELISRQQIAKDSFQKSIPDLTDDLTVQQRNALEAALEGGYFEWPRDKTGEEIAESLGITAPTFHRHLRISLRKIVSNLLS